MECRGCFQRVYVESIDASDGKADIMESVLNPAIAPLGAQL